MMKLSEEYGNCRKKNAIKLSIELIIYKFYVILNLSDMHKKFRRKSITNVFNYFAETVSKLQFHLQLRRSAFEVSVSMYILMRIYMYL